MKEEKEKLLCLLIQPFNFCWGERRRERKGRPPQQPEEESPVWQPSTTKPEKRERERERACLADWPSPPFFPMVVVDSPWSGGGGGGGGGGVEE